MKSSTKITTSVSIVFMVLFFYLMEDPYFQDLLYSPAPLHLSHQGDVNLKQIKDNKSKVRNIEECKDCHKPWKRLNNDVCLECHDKDYFEAYSSETIRDTHVTLEKQSCYSCHTEHTGKYGNITPVVTGQYFDHKSIKDYEAESSNWKARLKKYHINEKYYQKLPLGCILCHKEAQTEGHPTMTDDRCILCHNDEDWGETDFTHWDIVKELNKAQLDCESCHPSDFHVGQGVFNIRLGFDCYGCHAGDFSLKPDFINFKHIETKKGES